MQGHRIFGEVLLFVGGLFRFLTFCASSHIFFNELSESWAFVVFSNQLPSISDTWVSSCGGVVDPSEGLSSFFWVVFEEDFSGEE